MANLAVFTSGNGSNFQAISEKILATEHRIGCMICDRKDAWSFRRAELMGIKSYYVSYYKREKTEAEKEIIDILENERIDIIALAGFMRLLTPSLINRYINRIINIHPALLPKHPGTHGIEESYNSDDKELGVTIHYVDEGVDTGPVIMQKSFIRSGNEPIEEIEKKIHNIEHTYYPEVIKKLLDNYCP